MRVYYFGSNSLKCFLLYDTGKLIHRRRTDGRTDVYVILSSVQCCALHWTDNKYENAPCTTPLPWFLQKHYSIDSSVSFSWSCIGPRLILNWTLTVLTFAVTAWTIQYFFSCSCAVSGWLTSAASTSNSDVTFRCAVRPIQPRRERTFRVVIICNHTV